MNYENGTGGSYIRILVGLLDQILETQGKALELASVACSNTIAQKGLVHLFGSGHSVIPTMDAYPRYGSFVGLHPLYDPRLMWHNVLGPGGVRELLWLERTENYIGNFLGHEPLHEEDVLIVFSHSGLNAAGIEAAQYAKQKGLITIAVTSSGNDSRPVGHSSGQRLSAICDIHIDTGVPCEDAVVQAEGLDRPLGGASTIVATGIMQEIVVRTGLRLLSMGIQPLTFVSPTVPGADLSSNDEVFAEHDKLVHRARGRNMS